MVLVNHADKKTTLRYWQHRIEAIGPAAAQWAKRAVAERGAEAIRSLMGIARLLNKHTASHIDQACSQALENSNGNNPSLRSIGQHLPAQTNPTSAQSQPASHPIIRELFVYGQFVQSQTDTQTHTTTPTP